MAAEHSNSPDILLRISGEVHKGLSALTQHPKYQRQWEGCCANPSCERNQVLQNISPDSLFGAALREQNAPVQILSALAESGARQRLDLLRKAVGSKSGGRNRVWRGVLDSGVQYEREQN